jgi:hypothetical protein
MLQTVCVDGLTEMVAESECWTTYQDDAAYYFVRSVTVFGLNAAAGTWYPNALCDKLNIHFPESMFIDTPVLVISALHIL